MKGYRLHLLIIHDSCLIISPPAVVRQWLIYAAAVVFFFFGFAVVNSSRNISFCFLFLRDINMVFISTLGFRYYVVAIILVNLRKS